MKKVSHALINGDSTMNQKLCCALEVKVRETETQTLRKSNCVGNKGSKRKHHFDFAPVWGAKSTVQHPSAAHSEQKLAQPYIGNLHLIRRYLAPYPAL